MANPIQVTFDAADPPALGAFWALALDYVEQPPPDGHDSWDAWCEAMGIPPERRRDAHAIVDPTGAGPRVFFQRVPEDKVHKNRVHLDVSVSGGPTASLENRRPLVDDKVAELVAAGATQIARFDREDDYWVVLADPEGNEFCVT
ncbi:MAG: VOC family protein [Acidimicrobiia bacterium]